LHERGTCREIGFNDLFSERLGEALHALWLVERAERVAPVGVHQAADVVERFVVQGRSRRAEQAAR
jgi:hypothetical protein